MAKRIIELELQPPQLRVKALLREGKVDGAARYLEEKLRQDPEDHAAWHQLAHVETQRKGYFAANGAIKHALLLQPANVAYLRFKALTLTNLGSCKEAIEILQPFVQTDPKDYFALHAMQMACARDGQMESAIRWGHQILALEDEVADRRRVIPVPKRLGAKVRRKRVIAFGLWGSNPIYNYGALVNARLVRFIYPGWNCRFYVGADVPPTTLRLLKNASAEVINAAERHQDISSSLWRFLVADDPAVRVFLCRDSDSRLSTKEAAAVDVWLRSGKWCHIMRDHVLHRNVMLAGMWGARTVPELQIADRIRHFLPSGIDERYGADQRFLALEIWPLVRGNCMIHDSYYPLFDSQPFPVMGKGDDRFHVGMGYIGEEGLRREAALFGLPWPIAD